MATNNNKVKKNNHQYFEIKGYELREYIVKPFGNNGAHIILTNKAIGQKVKVVYTKPLQSEL